jgi:L-alanine-DL-glutamate epimerase-like enolase superfamily enzyme
MGAVDFRDGYIYLSEEPGLGIEWDEDAITKYGNDV